MCDVGLDAGKQVAVGEGGGRELWRADKVVLVVAGFDAATGAAGSNGQQNSCW